MDWIDTCCRGGTDRYPSPPAPSTEDFLDEMERLQIGQALVYSAWSDYISSEHANLQLFDDLKPHPRLLPVPEVTPEGGEFFLDQPDWFIADLCKRGAAAGYARLKKNGFVLTSWCAGPMLDAMQQRRLPLMVQLGEVDPDHLFAMLRDFPKLPVILQGVPRIGFHRIVYPLLNWHENLHVVCAVPHSVHLGIDYLVKEYGPAQFLWGSNWPKSEPGASIAGVTYADIDDDAKAAIAGGNIKRLLKEVVRG